jgi:hypothetical protein
MNSGNGIRIPLTMLTPCIILVGLSLITGLDPNLFYQPVLEAVRSILAGF